MNDTNWITEILLDIARFAEENELPKTYELLIEAMKVAANEARRNNAPAHFAESNVVSILEGRPKSFAVI